MFVDTFDEALSGIDADRALLYKVCEENNVGITVMKPFAGGHCKPCPADIDIAMVNKYYDLATIQDSIPASVKSHYQLLAHHASECLGCAVQSSGTQQRFT